MRMVSVSAAVERLISPTSHSRIWPRAAAAIGMRAMLARSPMSKQRAPGARAYTAIEGIFKVFKSLVDGRLQITGFLLSGDLGLPSRGQFMYSAEVGSWARLCAFPRRQLLAMFDSSPGLEKRLLEIVDAELTMAQHHMLLLGRRPADEGVACFLLELAERFARVGWPSDPMTLPVGRGAITDYLGRSFSHIKKTSILYLAQ
jgi:CRP/FNR family transcriptional regulator